MVQGANPVWNPEETQKTNGLSHGLNPLYRDEDKEFEDSESNDGDDVFIGVENQDDFKGYKDRYDVSFKLLLEPTTMKVLNDTKLILNYQGVPHTCVG